MIETKQQYIFTDNVSDNADSQPVERVLRPYQRERLKAVEASRTRTQTDYIIDVAVIFILFHFLGFPGKLTNVLGNTIGTLIDYGCFALQLGLMLISSDSELLQLKLLDFKFKYFPLYLYAVATILISIIAAGSGVKAYTITYTRFVVTMVFGIWLAERYTPEELLELWLNAQTLYILANLFFMLRYPGIAYQWHGVDGRVLMGLVGVKNGFSKIMSFGMLIQFTLLRIKADRKQLPGMSFFILLLLHIYLILLNKSVGGILFAVIPAVYLFFFEPKMGQSGRLQLGFLYIVASVGFLFLALTIMPLLEPLFNYLGKDATLTGRVPLWKQTISVIMETHTIFGWGYLRFWEYEPAYSLIHAGFDETSFFAHMTAGSHNVILEIVLGTGLVGLTFFFLMFIISLRSIPYMREDQYVFCSGYILMFLLFGLTERGMAAGDYATLMLFSVLGLACSVALPPKDNLIRRHVENG